MDMDEVAAVHRRVDAFVSSTRQHASLTSSKTYIGIVVRLCGFRKKEDSQRSRGNKFEIHLIETGNRTSATLTCHEHGG